MVFRIRDIFSRSSQFSSVETWEGQIYAEKLEFWDGKIYVHSCFDFLERLPSSQNLRYNFSKDFYQNNKASGTKERSPEIVDKSL